jgi:DNA-binding MarR family transcriptional regulator
MIDKDSGSHGKRPSGAAFLLAQIGAHAASKFAERLSSVDLVPAHAGILRMLGATPALTQQALADALHTVPSRIVALVDELEDKNLIERQANEDDRRSYALHLTEKGRETLQTVERIAREHQKALFAGLTDEERQRLAELLQKVADQQGLIRHVHPGFARLRSRRQ